MVGDASYLSVSVLCVGFGVGGRQGSGRAHVSLCALGCTIFLGQGSKAVHLPAILGVRMMPTRVDGLVRWPTSSGHRLVFFGTPLACVRRVTKGCGWPWLSEFRARSLWTRPGATAVLFFVVVVCVTSWYRGSFHSSRVGKK